jgi:hypothetical protein
MQDPRSPHHSQACGGALEAGRTTKRKKTL